MTIGATTLAERFCDRLRNLRDFRGLSQRQAAQAAGITQPNYQRIESGLADPKLSTVLELATALEVAPSYFFDEDYPSPSQ